MGALFDLVRRAVAEDRYIISAHANQRLRERRIPAWQIISGVSTATIIAERPDAKPNPVVELRQLLADATEVKAVWAWLAKSEVAKLVTVHFFDGDV